MSFTLNDAEQSSKRAKPSKESMILNVASSIDSISKTVDSIAKTYSSMLKANAALVMYLKDTQKVTEIDMNQDVPISVNKELFFNALNNGASTVQDK